MKGSLPEDYEPYLKKQYCEGGLINLRSMVEIQAKDINPGRVCNKYARRFVSYLFAIYISSTYNLFICHLSCPFTDLSAFSLCFYFFLSCLIIS